MISLPCLLFLPMVSSNVGVEIKKKENIIKVKVTVVCALIDSNTFV